MARVPDSPIQHIPVKMEVPKPVQRPANVQGAGLTLPRHWDKILIPTCSVAGNAPIRDNAIQTTCGALIT